MPFPKTASKTDPKSVSPAILALETSTEHCSCALLIDDPAGTRVLVRSEHAGQSHSERILPMVAEVLQEAGLALNACSAIAYGAGPGSFTGLRIACAVAQGLAYGAGADAGLPVLGIGNLTALCEQVRAGLGAACPPGTRILAAQDARMGEVYWALCQWSGEEWDEIEPASLAKPDEIVARLDGNADFGCGNAFRIFADALVPLASQVRDAEIADARWIAALGVRAWRRGLARPAREAAPLYVRDRVALTTAERALRSGPALRTP